MKKTEDGYYTNRHSSFLLQYHLVLITKYRHPVIAGAVEEKVKEYFPEYLKKQGLEMIAMETMPDHVHILFEAPPQICLSTFVNAMKAASSRVIRRRFGEELKPYYWKPYFWSESYYIGTASEASTKVVEEYIKNQKE